MDRHQSRHLGWQIKETKAFSSRSLLLGILASLICAATILALGTFVNTRRGPTPTAPVAMPAAKPTVRPKLTPPAEKHAPMRPSDEQAVTGFEAPASRQCPKTTVGESESCKQLGLGNVGATSLQVSTSELGGENAGDFVLTRKCDGMLKPGTACSIKVRFRPTAAGVREAFVVVTVSPGDIAHRIRITGAGNDELRTSGFEIAPD
ncbi:hypothetical protein OHA70_33725 [Kribbella sp. NBC_00382]|uniref:hypothetical protein n=1 Tax=Kribbella sp. NBC_00382 TaxID=2975967 RepID=UPI002E21243D